jgi:uncharacterized protein YwbE
LADAAGGVDAADRQILSGPGTSHWLKDTITSALDRDPVDAVNDAELLAMLLGHRADQITAMARAALDVRVVIKWAQKNGDLTPGPTTKQWIQMNFHAKA